MSGDILIYISFGAALVSLVLYLISGDDKKLRLQVARFFYYIFAASAAAAMIYLIYLFLDNRFEFKYVYGYSSRDLPFWYKLSAAWAGQEGTFLLWIFFAAVIGLWVMFRARKNESTLMPFFIFAQIFIFIMMFIRSPFDTHPVTPLDGRGLNPLLQNFWMVIHPPVMFVGYAALSVPYAYAMTALVKNEYRDWVDITMPWVAFSVLTMGAGVFLGAYWSYETLGWGGFWGWDPVENSSLVPWLVVTALLHGMLIEKSRGSLRKTNLLLACLSYVLVLYGTYLTRSGVLSDFSVHSFIDLGFNNFLLFFLAFYAVISIGLLIFRLRRIDSEPLSKSYFTRDFFVYLTLLILIISGLIILLGTSAPIITGIIGESSAVRIDFYINTHLPLSMLMTLAMALFPFTFWKNRDKFDLGIRIVQIAIPALLALFMGMAGGMATGHAILLSLAIAAFLANLLLLFQRLRKSPGRIGGMLAHAGLGLLIIGSIGSTGYSETRHLTASGNKQADAFDREFELNGVDRVGPGKRLVKLHITQRNESSTAGMYFTNTDNGVFRTPFIEKYLTYDLYISPGDLEVLSGNKSLVLSKGETGAAGDYRFRFDGFKIGMGGAGHAMAVGADITIIHNDDSVMVQPVYRMTGSEFSGDTVTTEFGGSITIDRIDADRGMIVLDYEGFGEEEFNEPLEILHFQVSKKPLINLVWIGGVMILLGSFFSLRRRLVSSRPDGKRGSEES
jgi:cytochrome c-type biogenesis protein CcmF